jgi:hypothetical protein
VKELIHTGIGLLIFGFLLPGCAKRTREATIVARVDQAVLTTSELPPVADSSAEARRQAREFVNDWITSELLFQEAMHRGLSDSVQLQLAAVRRRLLIDALLNQELYAGDTSLVNERDLHELYDAEGKRFLLREDVARISYVLFAGRDAANEFRTRVLRGVSWNDAVRQMSIDSVLNPQILQVADQQYFTKSTMYPEELWKLARTLPREEVSFAVTTQNGTYVLILHNFKKQGDVPEWDFIRNEIRERLLIEQRRQKYETLVARLRAQHEVEVRLEFADSASHTND